MRVENIVAILKVLVLGEFFLQLGHEAVMLFLLGFHFGFLPKRVQIRFIKGQCPFRLSVGFGRFMVLLFVGGGVVYLGIVLYKGGFEFQEIVHDLRFLLGGELIALFFYFFDFLLTESDKIEVEQGSSEDTVFL